MFVDSFVFIELNNSEWHNHAQEKVSGTARVKILWESQHRDWSCYRIQSSGCLFSIIDDVVGSFKRGKDQEEPEPNFIELFKHKNKLAQQNFAYQNG